ncbi:hypothetical protein QOZ96_002645 [Brevundimonas nasdae]|uniref:hypothetical protein n=1 Tax=Brevundimonas nasdae TaxID=172043 RepID=UPI001911E7A7|nr:hypothetical protein [Brevundimonas nasdae]MBK6025860.1 hypothetical protein [Brevundimonas nasdae]MDQ0452692.1 hypothetical protein [Brevundimonas nasdae]
MERLLLVLGTVPARITAGLACMAALAVLLAPGEGWTADWEKVVAFVAALGLWGLAEARCRRGITAQNGGAPTTIGCWRSISSGSSEASHLS